MSDSKNCTFVVKMIGASQFGKESRRRLCIGLFRIIVHAVLRRFIAMIAEAVMFQKRCVDQNRSAR